MQEFVPLADPEVRPVTDIAPMSVHTLPGLGRLRMRVRAVYGGPDEVAMASIGQMADYARADAADPRVMAVAKHLTNGSHSKRESCERIWQWVHQNCVFEPDEATGDVLAGELGGQVVEVFRRPVDMLDIRRGDCDCFSMLVAALLLANGIKCAFRAVGANPNYPDEYSHVYVVAYPEPGSEFAMDASHGQYPGWEVDPAKITKSVTVTLEVWPAIALLLGVLAVAVLLHRFTGGS